MATTSTTTSVPNLRSTGHQNAHASSSSRTTTTRDSTPASSTATTNSPQTSATRTNTPAIPATASPATNTNQTSASTHASPASAAVLPDNALKRLLAKLSTTSKWYKCVGTLVSLVVLTFTILAFWPGLKGAQYDEEALKLARWTASKDFREQCQAWLASGKQSAECEAVTSIPPSPPPNIRIAIAARLRRSSAQMMPSDSNALWHHIMKVLYFPLRDAPSPSRTLTVFLIEITGMWLSILHNFHPRLAGLAAKCCIVFCSGILVMFEPGTFDASRGEIVPEMEKHFWPSIMYLWALSLLVLQRMHKYLAETKVKVIRTRRKNCESYRALRGYLLSSAVGWVLWTVLTQLGPLQGYWLRMNVNPIVLAVFSHLASLLLLWRFV